MSASRNPDGPGVGTEFHSKVDRDEPMQTGGHKPGKMVGNDALPESQIEVLPAGTAPPSKTFEPNASAVDNTSSSSSTHKSKLVDDVLADADTKSTNIQSNVAPGTSETPTTSTTATETSRQPELKQNDAISGDNSTRPGTTEDFGVSQSAATTASTSTSAALPESKQEDILSATDAARPGASEETPVGLSQSTASNPTSDNIKSSLDTLSEAAPATQSISDSLPTASQAADAVKSAAASLISGVQSLAFGAKDAAAENASASTTEGIQHRSTDEIHVPGEYKSGTTDAEDKSAVQRGMQSVQDTLPSTEQVKQSVQSAQDSLPSTQDVKTSLQSAQGSIPSTQDVKSSLQSAQSSLPGTEDVKSSLQSAQASIPSTGDVKSSLQSASGNIPSTDDVKNQLPDAEAVKGSLPDLASASRSLPDTGITSEQTPIIGSNGGSIAEQAQGAATSVQNQAQQAVTYVKEQVPGQQTFSTGTETIKDQHATSYTGTEQLDGQVPFEPSAVPQVVTESQRLALASPEATANPEAVQEKKEVERELQQGVSLQPVAQREEEVGQQPASSNTTSDLAAAASGTLAAAGAAIAGAATVVRGKTHEATGTDPVAVMPESAQRAIDGEVISPKQQPVTEKLSSGVSATGDALTGAASSVNETVTGAASSAGEAVRSAASSTGETVSGVASSARDTTTNAASSAHATVAGAASSAGESLRGTATSMGETARGVASSTGDTVTGAASTTSDTVTGAASSAHENAVGAATYTRERTQQTTGTDPVSILPISAQKAIDGEQNASSGISNNVSTAGTTTQHRETLDPEAILSAPPVHRAAEKVPDTGSAHSETLDSSFPRVFGAADSSRSAAQQENSSTGEIPTIPRVFRTDPVVDPSSGVDPQPGIRLSSAAAGNVRLDDPDVSGDALPEPGLAVKTVSHIGELRTADVSTDVKRDVGGNGL